MGKRSQTCQVTFDTGTGVSAYKAKKIENAGRNMKRLDRQALSFALNEIVVLYRNGVHRRGFTTRDFWVRYERWLLAWRIELPDLTPAAVDDAVSHGHMQVCFRIPNAANWAVFGQPD